MKSYVVNNPLRHYRRMITPGPFKMKGIVEIAGRQYTFYGNPELLEHPDIHAVRLSRRLSNKEIKQRSEALIGEASRGAVLAGPFIRRQEKKIMTEGAAAGGSIIRMVDNAIGERYSLKAPFDELFIEGRGLLIGPAESLTRALAPEEKEPFFHSLNDLAAALEDGAGFRILKAR